MKIIKSEISDKETSIVKMLADGLSSRTIAAKLKVNYNTLATELKFLRNKCGAKNATHLVAIFIRNGYIR
jgi:DNA-binding CsgD family transcriptional regulator